MEVSAETGGAALEFWSRVLDCAALLWTCAEHGDGWQADGTVMQDEAATAGFKSLEIRAGEQKFFFRVAAGTWQQLLNRAWR